MISDMSLPRHMERRRRKLMISILIHLDTYESAISDLLEVRAINPESIEMKGDKNIIDTVKAEEKKNCDAEVQCVMMTVSMQKKKKTLNEIII